MGLLFVVGFLSSTSDLVGISAIGVILSASVFVLHQYLPLIVVLIVGNLLSPDPFLCANVAYS